MIGRMLIAGLVVGVALPATAAFAGETSEAVLRRDEDAAEVVVAEDDNDDFTGNTGGDTGNTGNSRSNDATGSRHTGASAGGDRSRGDQSRDWTRDGSGDRKRDWSGGHTNDNTRNDTR